MTGKPEERHAQLELCIPYVFGRLNPGNRKQFEAHLATGCEQCVRELAGLYEATALLPLLLRQESPPAGLRQRVVSRASSRRTEPPRSERGSAQRESPGTPVTPATRPERPWYPLAATVIGILLILALAFFVYQLAGTTATQEKQIAELQTLIRQKDEVLAIVSAQQLEVVSLATNEPGSIFYGKILWDTSSRNAALQISGLPALPEGKIYQLWMMKEKKYFTVGEPFGVGQAQPTVIKVLSLPIGERSQIEEFVLTVEPKEGSTQPSAEVYLRSRK
jgi:hypothetical protein